MTLRGPGRIRDAEEAYWYSPKDFSIESGESDAET